MRTTTDARKAAAALADGRLVAVPTETVYGLGGRADLATTVACIYEVKGRPADHPLIVHVIDIEAAWQWASSVPEYARQLAQACWPGPLTIVLPRSARAGDFITGGQATVAVRVPSHPVMRTTLEQLVEITGDPAIGIAAPSANRFGKVSPTTAQHVLEELDDYADPDDLVLDGGPCEVGVESTIVDCTGEQPVLLRPGHVSASDIERITGMTLGTRTQVRAPGMLESHYSPTARVQIVTASDLNQLPAIGGSAGLIALEEVVTPPGVVRLSAPADAEDYARILYSALREADALDLDLVLAVPPSSEGIGSAVLDRLLRAAAGE